MRIHVGLLILEGVDASVLDDVVAIEVALRAGVEAGAFSLHELVAVRFAPHGVTGTAVVGESHLSLHTWPEEGRAFVDVASCKDAASMQAALDAIVKSLPGARVTTRTEYALG